jgi:hypothetical protein
VVIHRNGLAPHGKLRRAQRNGQPSIRARVRHDAPARRGGQGRLNAQACNDAMARRNAPARQYAKSHKRAEVP